MKNTLIRLTPKRAPFRRAGVHFKTMDALIVPEASLTIAQLIQLTEEPLVDLDLSRDDGEHWRRFTAPPEGPAPRATSAALSPERAIDPTGPIVPHAPLDDGEVPPEAADPAVPIGPASGDIAGADAADVADDVMAADVVGEAPPADVAASASADRLVGHEDTAKPQPAQHRSGRGRHRGADAA